MVQTADRRSPAKKPRGALDGFLDTIERVGKAVPHPVVIFPILIAIVIAPSAVPALVGVGITYDRVNPGTGEIETVTTGIRSLLSADGIRFMVTSPVANFLGFGAVGVIIVAMVGVGSPSSPASWRRWSSRSSRSRRARSSPSSSSCLASCPPSR